MKKNTFLSLAVGLALIAGLNSCSKEDDKVYGSLTGTIINSQTGQGMADVTVSLSTTSNSDNAKASDVTDVSGTYVIEKAEVGTYNLIIEAEGYFVRVIAGVEIIEGDNFQAQEVVVETPSDGSLRIILRWSELPYDLDSHLTGPLTEGGTFHVYYWDYYSADTKVDLDVDDTYSYGPETVTIHSFVNGTYRYSVHNYSDQTSTGGQGIDDSPTAVEVYDADGLVSSFVAPTFTGSGNTWRVFEIEALNGSLTINPINQYVLASSDDDLTVFKNTGSKAPMSIVGF